MPRLSLPSLQFAEPLLLWLLLALVPFVALLGRQALRRRRGVRQLASRTSPVRQRLAVAGDLPFWALVMVAMAAIIVALARPATVASVTFTAGADIVLLLDGSASMRVADAAPDRWRRAVRWIRTFAETLPWRQDRVALGLFARNAAPQLRLTRDPNALFFFIDHLGDDPPFRLDLDTTWDTNLEAGLRWGMRVLAKNEELYGPSPNGKAFVVLTDGQTWSGDVRRALEETVKADVPIYVVGVGSAGGGVIPEPGWSDGFVPLWAQGPPVRSRLDRASLQDIALTGRGRYFELDRESDRAIALRIIAEVRARGAAERREEMVDVHWYSLLAGAAALGLALLATRDRAEIWGQMAALVAALAVLTVAMNQP